MYLLTKTRLTGHYKNAVKVAGYSNFNLYSTNKELTKSNYEPIYRFPHIKSVRLLGKLKIYHGILSAFAIPTIGIMNYLALVPVDYVAIVTTVGISGLITFTSFGTLAHNFIGFMYLNREKATIKISYLDIWARRKETEIPIDDIVPLSEVNHSVIDVLYVKLQRYSTKEIYKLHLPKSEILDLESFQSIFGVNETEK